MSATQVGIFGVVMATLAALGFRFGFVREAFWLAMIAVLTDMADGEVARATNTETPQGNYLDAVGDRLRECILLLGLLPLSPDLVALALLGTCLTSFAKARCSLVLIMDNSDWSGLGDHADRAVLILVCYLVGGVSLLPLLFYVLVTWACFYTRARAALARIEQAEDSQLLPYLRTNDDRRCQ